VGIISFAYAQVCNLTQLSSEGGRAGKTGQDELKQPKLNLQSEAEPQSAQETDRCKGSLEMPVATSPFEVIAAGI
jgi:hypothetical protein